ncbi:transposable element Tc1 transposase [Trichonephila clavipes]|nr:transposable element Tc1 transposase [Trichonephila clavipes]
MLYPVVESCLPTKVLKAWDGHRLNREVPEYLALEKEKVLEILMIFLRQEIEGEKRHVLAENAFGSSTNRSPISNEFNEMNLRLYYTIS